MQDHASEVEKGALARCPEFLVPDVKLAAIFHDLGKYSDVFKRRLEGKESGLDHWAPGAHVLLRNGPSYPYLSELAGVAVHGHHVGLGKWNAVSALREKLVSVEGRKLTLATNEEIQRACQALMVDGFSPKDWRVGRKLNASVGSMLDARMVLSALVDADYTDTAHHMRGIEKPQVGAFNAVKALRDLDRYVKRLGKGASKEVREVRAQLRQAAQRAADGGTGLFTLEAPTGTGKTLAMLEFALRQMAKPGSKTKRLIVVLPFLSILDQTLREYQKALGTQAKVLLEHHSLAEWRAPLKGDEDENGKGAEKTRREAAEAFSEDWAPPVVITTTVQFFESLFTNHPGTSRKLCSIAHSVVLIDEVQTIPGSLRLATARALSRLAHPDYGCSVVLSSATQPLLSHFADAVAKEGENAGWNPTTVIGRSDGLYSRTRRYTIDWSRCEEPVSWDSIAVELSKLDRALCIVNTRKDARRLAEMIEGKEAESPVVHLSTNMCAAHRRKVIESAMVAERGQSCILISTQCVEAGVDLDFPVVYRALAPFDAIAQAAGRCNRAGAGEGSVCVFLPEEATYPGKDYEQGSEQTLSLWRQHPDLDPQDPVWFDQYFELIYGSANSPGTTPELEKAIEEKDFPKVAELYRLIDRRDLVHVLVPWLGAPEVPFKLTGEFFRKAQPYIVDANRRDATSSLWIGSPMNGTQDWYALSDDFAYDKTFGLRLNMELPIITHDVRKKGR